MKKYDSSSIKFITSTIRSDLCDYSDARKLVSRTITITGIGDDDNVKRTDKRNKGVIFQNCASLTNCISSINNIQIDNVMPMYILIEYSDNYSKTSGSLWQYFRGDQMII